MLEDLEAQNRLARELEPGERVLWNGRPNHRRWLYPQDAVLAPFSLAFGGFSILWEASVLSSQSGHGKLQAALWGVPFVVIGLYLMAGRLFARRWLRKRTLYAATEARALSIEPSWTGGERVTSVWFSAFPPVDEQLARNGRGTIWIGSIAQGQRRLGAGSGWPGARAAMANAVVFADVPDAADVYAKVRRQISGSTPGRATSR